jgi:hypothetical protein
MTRQEVSSTPSPQVSAVILALNEARNLPYVSARMPSDVHEVTWLTATPWTAPSRSLANCGQTCAKGELNNDGCP